MNRLNLNFFNIETVVSNENTTSAFRGVSALVQIKGVEDFDDVSGFSILSGINKIYLNGMKSPFFGGGVFFEAFALIVVFLTGVFVVFLTGAFVGFLTGVFVGFFEADVAPDVFVVRFGLAIL